MAEHLKVLLFSGRFEVRGSSAYTLRLAANLPEHNVETRIVCPDARRIEPERRARLDVREYLHIEFPGWGRVVRELLAHDLLDDPPDLVHIQSWNMCRAGAWLARRLDRPFLLTVHDYLPGKRRQRFDCARGKRIIAVSQSVRAEVLSRVEVPPELVEVVHGGVDVPSDNEAPPVLDAGHVPVVGTATPLETVKGVPFFLGAAQKILAARDGVEFLVSGAGPEEANLRRLARALGIAEHVTFVPNLPNFSRSLAAMDIFCLPSLRQGLGTIMLEAMALGRPVIATGVGGVYSVVHDNETGLVVPPSNSARLADRILELLADPQRARSIGESGRQLVLRDFGVAKMVSRTAELYREVLSESKVPALSGTQSVETGSRVSITRTQ
jgi:glycosyltransferase involved in cell wall biosynthesis